MTSKEFVYRFRKRLVSGADFFNPDTSLMKREQYDSAKLKILICFPTPHSNKTISSTAAALNDHVITHCPGCFIDFAYLPENSDISLYDQNNMPYAIGNITHLDPSHFDIIGFSISVLSDIVSAPVMLKSFDRCDKPIPLFWSDRKDLKLGEVPLVYAGGITAAYSDLCFGYVGNKQAFLDFLYLGECDKQDILFNRFIEARDTGYVTRNQSDHDIPGYAHFDLKNFESKVACSTIQDFVDAQFDCSWIYQPQAYEVKFNNSRQIISNKKVNPKALDFVTPYYPHRLPDDLGIGRTVINANGDLAGTSQTQVSNGCSASGACSFCAEGNYSGGWVEKSKERILEECWESKKYSAGHKYKPFSFNTNYLTDYKGMLREFRKIFPKVSFINMRMEELGRDLEAIKMMKYIGSNRMAAPIEGFSPRIQNNLLNKCLSEESLRNFMEDMVHAKLVDIKVGGIYTGYEEDEDFQWLYDFVKELKAKAADEGGNFPMRMNCTPLVHYPLTPIEFLERKTARRSYDQIRWFTDDWYNKYREVNLRIKMHGFRFSTYVEQSLIDLGRSLTPMIYKHFISTMTPIYTLRSIVTPEFVEDLNAFIDPEVHFSDRDPEHYISPCHRIHIELLGSYVPRARRLLRLKKQGDVFSNEPDTRCLKTYLSAKTHCQHNCIKNDPLKIYSDVEFVNGELQGDYTDLLGCERCQSNEERVARLARPIISTCSYDDLVATPAIPKVQKIRFILNRKVEYDVLNPNNTAYTFLSKFLQASDTLLHAYHSVVVHNMFWQSEPVFKYFCSGYQIVDTLWSANVIKEVKELIPLINSQLESTQIVSADDVIREENILISDKNIFYFETSDIPREVFDSAVVHYNGEIKVDAGTDASIVLETIQDKTLKPPVFVHKGKVCGVFALPLKYNPLAYMSGFLSTVKRYGFDAIAESFNFKCLMTMRETSAVCKNCGKEKALISIATSKPMPMGIDCLCKAILTQVVRG